MTVLGLFLTRLQSVRPKKKKEKEKKKKKEKEKRKKKKEEEEEKTFFKGAYKDGNRGFVRT